MEFLENIYSNLISEAILAVAIAILGFYFRRYIKKQEKRDAEQDIKNEKHVDEQRRIDEEQDKRIEEWRAEFERKLRSRDIRLDYFEKQRLTAYKQIRKYAQKARDEARLIQTPTLIREYDTWKQNLFENYAEVLELLHEYALLLEYFDYYESFHDFKNALLSFCLAAQKLNPLKEEERTSLKKEYYQFSKSWKLLTEQIKFPKESLSSLNVGKMS